MAIPSRHSNALIYVYSCSLPYSQKLTLWPHFTFSQNIALRLVHSYHSIRKTFCTIQHKNTRTISYKSTIAVINLKDSLLFWGRPLIDGEVAYCVSIASFLLKTQNMSEAAFASFHTYNRILWYVICWISWMEYLCTPSHTHIYIIKVRFVWTTERIFSRWTCLKSLWFGIDGNLLFSLIVSQKIYFWQKRIESKIVLPSPEAKKSAWNNLAFHRLRWWQHMIARGLHDSVQQRKLLALEKLFFYPGFIHLFSSDPTTPFAPCRKRFPIQIALLWQSIRFKGRCLNVLEYIHHRLSPPNHS